MLVTPDRIRRLQRKLYAKAKQEPAYRFYALYDKVCQAEILAHAWRLVRSNAGAPGVDGVSFEAIESGVGIETFLRELVLNYGLMKLPTVAGWRSAHAWA